MQGRFIRRSVEFFSNTLILLGLLWSTGVSADDVGNALWVAESSGVIKVATVDGSVLLEIMHTGDTQAVAVDQVHDVLWVYGDRTLSSYDFDGGLQSQVIIADTHCQTPSHEDRDHRDRGNTRGFSKPGCDGQRVHEDQRDGSAIQVYTFPTTSFEETIIKERISNGGINVPGFCAVDVSSTLMVLGHSMV
ncbi:MAG: hypothetical protein P8101_06605 [Candidatus Thiodiazotropha sp.]